MSEVKEYRGVGLVVRFDAARCIHAGECVHGAPEVFDPKAKPWIQPDKGDAERLIAVVAKCPSGALTAVRDDGSAVEQAPASNEVHLTPDGPLFLRGDIAVHDGDGKLISRETRLALCRCGHTKTAPFCDNSHGGANFEHDGACAQGEMPDIGSGALKLTVLSAGPVQCDGPLTVFDAFGDEVFRGEQCWFCRCGASANKPFCDGSHKTIGFSG
jgi:uncharacterized Fe-S cluster protein YjdI/CDGSH-type Zn-finger protein